MAKSLYYLVKLFNQKEYAEAFRQGRVYAQKLSCFHKYEEGRGDPSEGTVGLFQPMEGMKIEITATTGPHSGETVTLTEKDLAGPMTMGSNYLRQLNAFCMFGIYGGSPELEKIRKDQRVEFPERWFREFGPYAVIIKDVRQFIERVERVAKREGYQSWFYPVEYYDPSIFHGHMKGVEGAFRKPVKFEYQRECRIVFDTSLHPGALTLDVRDLSDISMSGIRAHHDGTVPAR